MCIIVANIVPSRDELAGLTHLRFSRYNGPVDRIRLISHGVPTASVHVEPPGGDHGRTRRGEGLRRKASERVREGVVAVVVDIPRCMGRTEEAESAGKGRSKVDTAAASIVIAWKDGAKTSGSTKVSQQLGLSRGRVGPADHQKQSSQTKGPFYRVSHRAPSHARHRPALVESRQNGCNL